VSQYAGSYVPQGPYNNAYDPAAFAMQTGYEGFLVPMANNQPTLFSTVRALVPSMKTILFAIGKIASVLIGATGVLLFGALLTTITCAFTPFCTISFLDSHLNKFKTKTQEIAEQIGQEVTAERVKRAAEFVKLALEKYNQLNAEIKSKTNKSAAEVAEATVEAESS
jgi:hypothetical protein